MAKRYSGSLQISVVYDDHGFYRTAVSRGGKLLWRGRINPAPAGFGRGVAYDSEKAYDEIASSALAFAGNDHRSEDEVGHYAEWSDEGPKIRRVPRYWEQYPGGRVRPKRFARRDVTARRAEIIRRRHRAFESARETYDPKRFKRGGGYKPEEWKENGRKAGGKAPSNRAMSKLEVYEFKANPPDKLFAYYDKDMRHVTTWMGDKLGTIISKGKERRPMGGKVVSIRVRGINGVTYAGTCNLSSGTYCRLRRVRGR